MRKKILISGATGLIGTLLTKNLKDDDYDITIFTRDIESAKKRNPYASEYVLWDFHEPESWYKYLEDKYAIVHLAGANLFDKRWTEDYKKVLYNSRVLSTRNLINAIEKLSKKPELFICASGISYYGDSGEQILTEDSVPGNDFLAKLTLDWEKEAAKVEPLGIRRVSVRTGIALSKDSGALKLMLPIFKLFVGGTPGNGKQWFPWIHIQDLINIYRFVIENSSINGPVNAVSANPVTMKEFVKTLGHIMKRPSIFKVPKFAVKIVLGEFAEYVTVSTRGVPQKLLENNFKFQFGDLEAALDDILNKQV
jgi:uncharacterized protein (TIGR01777 family)